MTPIRRIGEFLANRIKQKRANELASINDTVKRLGLEKLSTESLLSKAKQFTIYTNLLAIEQVLHERGEKLLRQATEKLKSTRKARKNYRRMFMRYGLQAGICLFLFTVIAYDNIIAKIYELDLSNRYLFLGVWALIGGFGAVVGGAIGFEVDVALGQANYAKSPTRTRTMSPAVPLHLAAILSGLVLWWNYHNPTIAVFGGIIVGVLYYGYAGGFTKDK